MSNQRFSSAAGPLVARFKAWFNGQDKVEQNVIKVLVIIVAVGVIFGLISALAHL